MHRTYFPVTVAGGVAYSDASPPIHGEIKQIRWHHAADTGQVASIDLALLPDADDTGLGWTFYARAAANVATPFVAVPTQDIHDAAAAQDTGSAPVVAAYDRVQLTVTPADTGVVIDGKLYIWHGD